MDRFYLQPNIVNTITVGIMVLIFTTAVAAVMNLARSYSATPTDAG